MKIAVIADPIVPVPPPKYGGSERIVHLMCRGLARRGHTVRLLAGPGSQNYGGGLTVHRPPGSAYPSRVWTKLRFQVLAWRAARATEVVINHGRLDYLDVLYRTRKPVIHWFHTPLTGREIPYVLRRRRRGDHFVGVSRSQLREAANVSCRVVYNALDLESLPVFAAPEAPAHVLFLGQLTREKGVHLAIEAAHRAGVKLVLGGKVPALPRAQAFFESHVKPRLGPACEWVGLYDEAKRLQLLAGARALLFPIQAEEAFGLVMIEALASGVPVIATRLYSTPEVIRPGENGFLCDTIDEMAAAIHRTHEISRARCRASVEQHFSEPVFMREVEALLAQAVAS